MRDEAPPTAKTKTKRRQKKPRREAAPAESPATALSYELWGDATPGAAVVDKAVGDARDAPARDALLVPRRVARRSARGYDPCLWPDSIACDYQFGNQPVLGTTPGSLVPNRRLPPHHGPAARRLPARGRRLPGHGGAAGRGGPLPRAGAAGAAGP